jgi:hypothetical protein
MGTEELSCVFIVCCFGVPNLRGLLQLEGTKDMFYATTI